MRILYIAEIVGKAGLYAVRHLLPTLRAERGIDFVIANGDGTTNGYGIGKSHAIQLHKLGIDVITGGDQTFFKKDMAEHISSSWYMLRPANLPAEMPGRGWRHFEVKPGGGAFARDGGAHDETVGDGAPDAAGAEPEGSAAGEAPPAPPVRIAVISLIGQSGFYRVHGNNPYTYLENVRERLAKQATAIFVDFHAMTTAEKYTMFHFADGMVTAIFGSGQRVQTADAHVMPSGTAVICDAGRTGSTQSIGGFAYEPEIRKYLTRLSVKSEEAWDGVELQGTLLELDPASGYVTSFEAIRVAAPPPHPQSPPPAKQKQAHKQKG